MIDDLRYGREKAAGEMEGGAIGEYAFLKIRYKLPDESTSRLITTPVGREREFDSIERVPGEARFAAAVAAFGQLLRDDPYTKDFTWGDVIDLARPARGEDPFGYRSEFLSIVRLAETARAMGDR
jgi:Ca-activated chloride channel family protein